MIMDKKRIILFLALAAMFVACNRIKVDFTYTPLQPKAGESVAFLNASSAGEDWLWTFGDNSTSLLKSPSKIYKKPGEYMVTLMVDSAKNQTCTKVIKIYDTIPTFLESTDSILHYQDVTLTANIYNPFSYPLSYQWTLSDNAVLVQGSLQSAAVTVYFKQPTDKEHVQLQITQNGKLYTIDKDLAVGTTLAPAVVFRSADGQVYRQRLIKDRVEQAVKGNSEDESLLVLARDTIVVFNGVAYYASRLDDQFDGFAGMQILHMQLDAMAQKWYVVTSEGLFVTKFDGTQQVLIDASATGAIYIDTNRSRVYWANAEGLYAMPLVKSKNNQFTTIPMQYNQIEGIQRISINNKLQ
jgi:PKD repeat protein